MSMRLRDVVLRIRALVSPRRVDAELDDELQFHIEREAHKLMMQGLTPREAQRRARATFGSVALHADDCRDARGIAFVDHLRQDLRYAFTMFRRAPLSAITIVVTIALGLGLVAAVFASYNALFLQGEALRNPSELFEMRRLPRPGQMGVWEPLVRADYDALCRDTQVFADAAATVGFSAGSVGTRISGQQASGTLVTGNFFQVLGATPLLGRTLTPADDERAVIVLSARAWMKIFGADPSVVGTVVNVGGDSYEIAGVMPPGFRGGAPRPPDYWAPIGRLGQLQPTLGDKLNRIAIDVIGRLKPGMSVGTATAVLTAWAEANPAMEPMGHYPKTIWLKPIHLSASDVWRGLKTFSPLFAVFGLILVIGCANVANLLLARGVARQREIGVRLSLGASRERVVRQLLTESLVLALAASGLGLGLSRLFLHSGAYAASALAPPDLAERLDVAALGIDWRVVVFLFAGAIVSTAMFGLWPALQATRIELLRTMRGEVTRDTKPGRARQALIAVQVMASSLLIIGALVFLRSAFAAANEQPTLRVSDTAVLKVLNESTRAAVLRTLRDDPAVAGIAASLPEVLAYGANADAALLAPDSTVTAIKPVDYKFVSPEYFDVLDTQLLNGRTFTANEQSAAAGVAVMSESTARRLWGGPDVVGHRIRIDSFTNPNTSAMSFTPTVPAVSSATFVVVGVVRDLRAGTGIFEAYEDSVYIPSRLDTAGASYVMRLRGDPEVTRQQLSERLVKIDPAVDGISTLRSMVGRSTFLLRVAGVVTLLLGALALVLTLSGLFSVLSYLVACRSTEIGVRMALGATPAKIGRLVLADSASPVVVGLVAGVGLTLLIGRVLIAIGVVASEGSVLRVFDPIAYSLSALIIVFACLLAAAVPARRASCVEPVVALRQD